MQGVRSAASLVVRRSIRVDAIPENVWAVLVRPEHNARWSDAFGARGPIESTWRPGAGVLWRNERGEVYVSGRVVVAQPNELLCFSVRDARPELAPTSGRGEDDITQRYALARDGGGTRLATEHGDFAKLAEGEALVPRVGALWDALLPRLARLAEALERA